MATLQDLMQYRDKIQVDIAILDFSKAFDTVRHNKLLYTWKHYGINGKTLQWMDKFLKQRSQ